LRDLHAADSAWFALQSTSTTGRATGIISSPCGMSAICCDSSKGSPSRCVSDVDALPLQPSRCNRVTCRDWCQLTLKEGLTVRASAPAYIFNLRLSWAQETTAPASARTGVPRSGVHVRHAQSGSQADRRCRDAAQQSDARLVGIFAAALHCVVYHPLN